MKKKYLLLATFLFLLIPKNTFAAIENTFDVPAMSIRYDNNVFQQNVEARSLFGYIFKGSTYNGLNGRTTYNVTTNLDKSKRYDIDFLLYQNNTGQQGNTPVLTFNDTLCTVLPFGNLVTYSQTTNLDLFYSFGGNTVPAVITGQGNELLAGAGKLTISPTSTALSFGYYVSCKNVDIVDTNKVKTYTSQSTCLNGNCFYGISSTFWYQQNEQSKMYEQAKEQLEETKKQTEETKKQTETIKDSDTTGAKDQAGGFFGDFKEGDYGFSDVLTAPLVFFRNLLGHSCRPLTFKLPMVDDTVTLPCIKPIYQQYFGLFFNLYQVITTGVIAYWVIIRLWATVKGLQDPQNDKIEVFKL